MQKNEGTLDRILRVVLGALLIVFAYLMNVGVASWVVGVIGVILLITGAIGFCGLYKVLGISTVKKEDRVIHGEEPPPESQPDV